MRDTCSDTRRKLLVGCSGKMPGVARRPSNTGNKFMAKKKKKSYVSRVQINSIHKKRWRRRYQGGLTFQPAMRPCRFSLVRPLAYERSNLRNNKSSFNVEQYCCMACEIRSSQHPADKIQTSKYRSIYTRGGTPFTDFATRVSTYIVGGAGRYSTGAGRCSPCELLPAFRYHAMGLIIRCDGVGTLFFFLLFPHRAKTPHPRYIAHRIEAAAEAKWASRGCITNGKFNFVIST